MNYANNTNNTKVNPFHLINKERESKLANKLKVIDNGIKIDISSVWGLCEKAGLNSFKHYESTGRGQKQCSNTIKGSTCGMYGEAAVELLFASTGLDYKGGWRDWVTGYANDRLPDGLLGDTPIEVKTIMNIDYPLGQIMCSSVSKYKKNDTCVIFVFVDTETQMASIYAMAKATQIESANIREFNLRGVENYQAIGITDMKMVADALGFTKH